MSNLLKQYYVVHQPGDKRIINSNGLAEERIREFVLSERAAGGAADGESGTESRMFVQGFGAAAPQVEPQPDPKEVADKILSDAREKADDILNDAHVRAQQMLEDADMQAQQIFEENRASGYAQGAQEREMELAELERQLQEECSRMEQEIEVRKAELDSEFQMRLDEMETDIIDALIPVFDKVFHISFGDKREILLALVRNTLMNVEVGGKIRIRVNEADRTMLGGHLDEIREQVGGDVTIEFVPDNTLSDGQCQLETAYGVFDCGIDTHLNHLIKDIRALV